MAQKAAEKWLMEDVISHGGHMIRRRKAIFMLARGLEQFMKGYGYRFLLGINELSSGIATVMYQNRRDRLVGSYVFEKKYGYGDEHIQHYTHTVDREAWENFWKTWGFWDDVSSDSPLGYFRRLDIEEYTWSQIDLDSSPQTRIVEAHTKDPEDIQMFPEEDYALTHF